MGGEERKEGGSVRCALEKGRTVTIGQCTKKTLSLSLSFHEWLTVMGWDGTWHLPSFPIRLFQCVRYTLPPTPPPPIFHYYYFSYSVVGAFILNYTTSIHLLILYYHTLMNCLFIYYFVNQKFNAIWVFGWLVFV